MISCSHIQGHALKLMHSMHVSIDKNTYMCSLTSSVGPLAFCVLGCLCQSQHYTHEDMTPNSTQHAISQTLLNLRWLRKILVSVNSRPQFWGRKWLRQFYGRLEKCVLSAGKIHAHKIPCFRGGGIWGFGGEGSADFILWAGGFSDWHF